MRGTTLKHKGTVPYIVDCIVSGAVSVLTFDSCGLVVLREVDLSGVWLSVCGRAGRARRAVGL